MAGLFERSRVRLLYGRHFAVERTTTIDNSAVDDLFRINRVQAARAGIATLRFVCVGTLDDLATIPTDVHIYVRSVRGDSLTERSGFELSIPVN
jgi:hypothetical protein